MCENLINVNRDSTAPDGVTEYVIMRLVTARLSDRDEYLQVNELLAMAVI